MFLPDTKRHKNFTDNLPKQTKSSGENEQIPASIAKKDKFY